MRKIWRSELLHYNLMMIPGFILLLAFSVLPMFGIILAFKDLNPVKGIWGSPWVGLEHYKFLMQTPQIWVLLRNTLVIAVAKLIAMQVVPFCFALALNEMRLLVLKRSVQTIVYLPHFLSWVILAGVFKDVFSLGGIINHLLEQWFHLSEGIQFLGSNVWFRPIIIVTHVWKEFGFSTIIYLAALTAINPALYEAAEIDGATRMQKIWHINVPGIAMTAALLATLGLDSVLNAGFDQIFNLYNILVYDTADIIDTYVYRVGLVQAQFELGTAIGLGKSIISLILIVITYRLAYKYANYRIW